MGSGVKNAVTLFCNFYSGGSIAGFLLADGLMCVFKGEQSEQILQSRTAFKKF